MQPGIKERIIAGGAHGKPVAEQLQQKEVFFVDEVDIDVTDDVEDMNGEPADGESSHHQHQEAEDLPSSQAVKLCLALCRMTRNDTVLQLDGDADVGE